MNKALIEVKNLSKKFPVKKSLFGKSMEFLQAVNNVSFDVYKGETFSIVGESGCGKSTARKLLLRLLDADQGEVSYKGQNIMEMNKKSLRELRKEMQVVFQDPYASLDPKWRIGNIIGEPLRIHGIGNAEERYQKVVSLMEEVGLRSEYYYRYPHEFSGGQRQRVGIARALALDPEVIIADEPISALDVSIQAQVLNMMKRLQEKNGLTYIFISHDLSIVRHISDRVAVMYLGEIVEVAETTKLFTDPKHPYTQALISSIPVPDPEMKQNLNQIEGEVPSPINPPSGCKFHTRCPFATEHCKQTAPQMLELDGHKVSCHLYTA
jgi:oligopeptide transport system ATP-binding protein